MARVTNSDTLPFVESRYELGVLASQGVRDVNGGAEPVVEKNHDKLTVVALREIASGKLNVVDVRHEFIESYKDAPFTVDEDASLEVAAEDPLLREIDAELENTLVDDSQDGVEDAGDDVADESENEE
ncbi:MAG: DNA-directed RNA polymerase subunit omega [Alphaproteobacteria bacterium]|nr:DNA-directed RNA polymerase subunit omega [Alphaproteobacteria bacterium]